jgi:hypothetical protein
LEVRPPAVGAASFASAFFRVSALRGTTSAGCADEGGALCAPIETADSAPTLVWATNGAAACGDLLGMPEPEVNATVPRMAADMAPAVSVVASL